MRLRDRVAVITGAGGPMGGAMADLFAAEGARLVLNDISEGRLRTARDRIAAMGRPVEAIRADVAEWDEAGRVVGRAGQVFGGVDILINVVGGVRGQLTVPFAAETRQRWEDAWRLNVVSAVNMVQLCLPLMQQRGGGAVVNISSMAIFGSPGNASYSAAKAALIGLTRTMARELAPAVRVNCIVPGIIATSVTQRLEAGYLERLAAATPLRRLGTPLDVAHATLFLASAESAYITGEALLVSGGLRQPAVDG